MSTADERAKANLDAFRDRFSGPYDLGGVRVPARPMFNMNSPYAANAKTRAAHGPELMTLCARAGVSASAVRCAQVGRPTPEQLVRVTQALIDAGKLPPGAFGTEELRIRQMQWEWGIGVDCAGYTVLAASAVFGRAAKPLVDNLMGDPFVVMKGSGFRRVDVGDVRAGDVIHLDAPIRGEVGHNVIVHDHRVLDRSTAARDVRAPAFAIFLQSDGPFHVLSVDSSWGAGDGRDFGGFRRDTWIYDAASKQWASIHPGTGELQRSPRGPQEEVFMGAFRPKTAP